MSDPAVRSKVNLDLSNLYIVIASLFETYLVSIKTLASTVFRNSTLQSPSI